MFIVLILLLQLSINLYLFNKNSIKIDKEMDETDRAARKQGNDCKYLPVTRALCLYKYFSQPLRYCTYVWYCGD